MQKLYISYNFIYIECLENGNYRDGKQISDYLWGGEWEGVGTDCK